MEKIEMRGLFDAIWNSNFENYPLSIFRKVPPSMDFENCI